MGRIFIETNAKKEEEEEPDTHRRRSLPFGCLPSMHYQDTIILLRFIIYVVADALAIRWGGQKQALP